MTIIRTKCPTCGDIDMGAGAISLYLEHDGERGAFAFVCPECLNEVSKPASRKTVALLIAAGVEPAEIAGDGEVAGPAPADPGLPLEDLSPLPEAPPFTLDDVIRFHFLLEDEVAIAELLSLDR
jgi:hypothetical protein